MEREISEWDSDTLLSWRTTLSTVVDQFQWKNADDILHVVVCLILILDGIFTY